MLKPLKTLYTTFKNYRDEVLIKINHTGQVIYLEKILNDEFHPIGRGIFITDSDDDRLDDYLYNYDEGQTAIYLYNEDEPDPVEIKNQAEYDGLIDFKVMIPHILNVTLTEVKALVERYRQAGKRYNIQTYQYNP